MRYLRLGSAWAPRRLLIHLPTVVRMTKIPNPIKVFRWEKVGESRGSCRYAVTYVQSEIQVQPKTQVVAM